MDSNPLHPSVIPLHCAVSQHAWGSPGASSLAARLFSLNKYTPISPTKPYSEFIVTSQGSHHAVLAANPTVSVSQHVQSQVIEVDAAIVQFYARLHEDGVPFVLKVVSVSSSNGLRVHPDAEALAAISPRVSFDYPKPRPLMIIAHSKVDMLFGFQPADEIVAQLTRVPEFADAVGRPETDRFVHLVKSRSVTSRHTREIVANLFANKPPFIADCLTRATTRLLQMPDGTLTESDRYLLVLYKLFPNDPMCFSVYLLNRVQILPAQAVFVSTGEPYCVLHGDFFEATAASDVDVYGGLTSLPVNSADFLDALSYDDSLVEVSNGEKFGDCAMSYVPPVPEFQVLCFDIAKGATAQLAETLAPCIMAVIHGEGMLSMSAAEYMLPLRPGAVCYLNPQTKFSIEAKEDAGSDLKLVQVGVNESYAPRNTSSSCSLM